MYTPYKSVAYEVWRVVSQKQPAPQPNYAEAQRTRITIGVTPVRGSKNIFTDLVLTRGGKVVTPSGRELSTHRYTFDFPAGLRSLDAFDAGERVLDGGPLPQLRAALGLVLRRSERDQFV